MLSGEEWIEHSILLLRDFADNDYHCDTGST